MQTKIYHKVYLRLLAEISGLLKVQICAPSDLDSWVLIEAPLLDKKILGHIEGWAPVPEYPEWLSPLMEPLLKGISDDSLDPQLLAYVRQVLVFCYKIEFEPTNVQLNEAIASFIDVDSTVDTWESHGILAETYPSYHKPVIRQAKTLISRVTAKCNFLNIVPKHGPGAVFPARKPWNKSMFSTCYSSIDRYYPWSEFFQVGLMTGLYEPLRDEVSVVDTIVCSLIPVPKDSRGPRLICVHPAEAIWIQQGQRTVLEDAIRKSPLTRDQISFDDQRINGKHALLSSINRNLVTLDLKEASDRVSSKLVQYLFGNEHYEQLSCARATHVQLPDGSLRELRKWAPMGNCLTFPVESLIFWSLVQASIISKVGRMSDDVYVFGDDIIFPSEHYDVVVNGLVMVGLVPNFSKTFRRGFFRESCGVDAYRGKDITPFRLRKSDIVCTQDAESYCKLAARLRISGFEHTASYIYALVSAEHGMLPFSNNPNSAGLYEYRNIPKSYFILRSFMGDPNYRFNHGLQRYEVRHKRSMQVLYCLQDCYRNNILDSLILLEQKDPKRDISDRGLEYAVPYTSRSTYGWSELLST